MTEKADSLYVVASQFAKSIDTVKPLGNGLINDTFLVTAQQCCFVLQRINQQVFPRPELISENLAALNRHIKKQVSDLQMPDILQTISGEANYYDKAGHCWRAQSFIEETESLEALRGLADAVQVGQALGHFHALVSTLPSDELHDTLPGFHITPGYLCHYHTVAGQGAAQDRFCAEFIDSYQLSADILEAAKQQKLLKIRVIHGDPKLNNFLFAPDGKIVSLIDLDTVKPGLVHYDIADCLRSCCHDMRTHRFDADIGAAILAAYLEEAGRFFTDADYDYLYPAIELLPFELGLRFYTDYLQGNRYFKVTDPLQNLRRAQEQFRLCASVREQRALIEQQIHTKRAVYK